MSNTGTTTPPDPNSLLTGGGGRSAKFENPGDIVAGEVTALRTTQQTDIDGTPKFWDNGDPRWQVVVSLQTGLTEDADDDGIRNLYVKGGMKTPTMQKAVSDALRGAGVKILEEGGRLEVAFIGLGTPSKPGLSAPKQYAARYTPPSAAVNLDAVFNQQPAPGPQAQVTATAPQTGPQAPTGDLWPAAS